MKKTFITFLLLLLLLTNSNSQKNDYFISVPIDSTESYRLKFISDSLIELSTIPMHLNPSSKNIYKFVQTNTAIRILPDTLAKPISKFMGIGSEPPYIKDTTTLLKIERGFIDTEKSLIYVKESDFERAPDIIYFIDGKKFIQDLGEHDSYGLVRKKPKKNRALERKLRVLNRENSTLELFRGLNAYKKFGIKYVFGTIVITTKK